MEKHKKALLNLILIFLFVLSSPMSVSANAPRPADHLTVAFSNIPEEAVYADLLIKINDGDSNYIDFQPNQFVDDALSAKEIVEYSSDGYRSFTFHYKNAKSNIKIAHYYGEYYCVDFCNGSEYQAYLTQYENLRNTYSDVKIALLDKDFNIIVVSQTTQLPKEDNAIIFSGKIYYDVSNDSIDIDTRINLYFVVFGGFLSILIILISIGTEIVLSLFFRFKGKHLTTILVVNACSQIIMRVLYIALPFPYLIETLILEMLVYIIEFFIYQKHFKEVNIGKIVCYTIIANTFSLLLGIFLDCYILA